MSTFYNSALQSSHHNNGMADPQFPQLPNVPGLPMRRQFTELHPKDQTIKLNRKARIESNWACNVQDCLPLHIRPRMELKKGAKARVGDIGVAEEIWWNWSVELLRSLEELSTMTATKLSFAQELLHLEVKQRQENPKHPQRKIVELLLGDVQRVIDGMRRNQQQRNMEMEGELDENEMGYDDEEYEDVQEEQQGNSEEDDDEMEHHGHDSGMTETPARTTYRSPMPLHNAPPSGRRSSTAHHHASPPASVSGDRLSRVTKSFRRSAITDIKAVEMRARAIRLRAQANKLEAEATELEVDVAELRAQME